MDITSTILFFLLGLFSIVIIYLTWRLRQQGIFHAQKTAQLLKNIREARDDQKDIIFRNLHDQLNPMLRFVVRKLELHQSALRRKQLTPGCLDQEIDTLLMALNDIRSSTHSEIPVTIKQNGFIFLLEKMLRQQAGSKGIEFQFINTTLFENDLPFDQLRQTDLYRISSELIENILRHSFSKRLDIVLTVTDEKLTVGFIHNGKGLTNEQAEHFIELNKGTGLKSCKARARFMNAEINYTTRQGLFTTELIVPFEWTKQLK